MENWYVACLGLWHVAPDRIYMRVHGPQWPVWPRTAHACVVQDRTAMRRNDRVVPDRHPSMFLDHARMAPCSWYAMLVCQVAQTFLVDLIL